MFLIVAYDVSTESVAGRRRLRRVAKVCEGMGQRVQKSVFECSGGQMELEALERRLLSEIEESKDCLRIYHLPEPVSLRVKEYGRFRALNYKGPLVA